MSATASRANPAGKIEKQDLGSAYGQDARVHLHSQTNLRKHEQIGPLMIVRADGVRVFDHAGREYLEAMSGLWCAPLGFNHPRLSAVAKEQMDRLAFYHNFAHRSNDVVVRLAEELLSLAPVPMSKVYFCSSGSEANDTMIKLVWQYQQALGRSEKRKIISREKGYHGTTVMGASLSGVANMHGGFGLPLPGIVQVSCPHYYRGAGENESEEQFAARLATELEETILSEDPKTIAAFIAEPVMGAGGVLVPPKGYFERIQPILKKYDILFLADEVVCGFSRTGSWWGSQTFGIRPDMVSAAKALSAAHLPISAVMISDEIYQVIADESWRRGVFGHGFTYSGHPVCAAVALEAISIYREMGTNEIARSLGRRLLQNLRSSESHPLVGEIRGTGLIAAVELVENKSTKKPFDSNRAIGRKIDQASQNEGLIIRAIGDSIAFCPAFISKESEIDEMTARFKRALDAVADALNL
jgi:4-aminobutyrate---pyruvate transaminase